MERQVKRLEQSALMDGDQRFIELHRNPFTVTPFTATRDARAGSRGSQSKTSTPHWREWRQLPSTNRVPTTATKSLRPWQRERTGQSSPPSWAYSIHQQVVTTLRGNHLV